MIPRTAVLVVTCDSTRYLPETLASIAAQDSPADLLIAIDDHSTDSTRELLASAGFAVDLATSPATEITTRIAHNFLQGLRRAQSAGADIVILGDHDDVWHLSRISHQVEILEHNPAAAMVASNGFLIDEHGVAIAGTLRDTFPVPADFSSWSRRKQWAYALRHSLATGGASALRPARLTDWSIPSGWLHDRWWSLEALRTGGLALDEAPVIDYRLSENQQVGLSAGDQDDPRRWLAMKARRSGRTLSRARDLTRLI